jgi:hypothetical protein
MTQGITILQKIGFIIGQEPARISGTFCPPAAKFTYQSAGRASRRLNHDPVDITRDIFRPDCVRSS